MRLIIPLPLGQTQASGSYTTAGLRRWRLVGAVFLATNAGGLVPAHIQLSLVGLPFIGGNGSNTFVLGGVIAPGNTQTLQIDNQGSFGDTVAGTGLTCSARSVPDIEHDQDLQILWLFAGGDAATLFTGVKLWLQERRKV